MAQHKRGTSGGNIAAVCRALAEPLAEQVGVSIWDVRFVKEGADFNGFWVALFKKIYEERKGFTSVNNIFNDNNVSTFNIGSNVALHFKLTANRAVFVTRKFCKV